MRLVYDREEFIKAPEIGVNVHAIKAYRNSQTIPTSLPIIMHSHKSIKVTPSALILKS